MNVELHYLYRDAGNYKQFRSIVFSNEKGLSKDQVLHALESSCDEGIYFNARLVGLPTLYFKSYNPSLDHDWHELDNIELSETSVDDEVGRDISDLISQFHEASIR